MSGPELTRRAALGLLASQMALLASGCSRPADATYSAEVLPYVHMPEGLVPGIVERYVTTLPLAGVGRGMTVLSYEGRPIKVEGNPRHPASLGATDVFAEAAVFELFDPDRRRTLRRRSEIASWEALVTEVAPRLGAMRADGGAGLRLVTGHLTSPTLLRQIAALLDRYPQARWHVSEPTLVPQAEDGARLAFGRPLVALPRLADARVVLTLDVDPLGPGPGQIAAGRAFAAARAGMEHAGERLRLYAAEATRTLTGANADHRIALAPADVTALALALARRLGAGLPAGGPEVPHAAARFLDAVAADLRSAGPAGLVLAGPTQPAEVHALAHWINVRLGAPVDVQEPVATPPVTPLAALADDLRAGRVETLLVLDANPVQDAPGELDLAGLIGRAGVSVQAAFLPDETGRACLWQVPSPHPLEGWSDLRAPDGTASLVQPLIRPLFDTHGAHELLALLLGDASASAHDLVRETWRGTWREPTDAAFETRWRTALLDGVIAGSAPARLPMPTATVPPLPPAPPAAAGLTLVFRPDPSLYDGRYANVAWLQECPHPLTKAVWGNAVHLHPDDAARLGVTTGDEVELSAGRAATLAGVRVLPGTARGVAELTLGGGRRVSGALGTGVGADAAPLRRVVDPWTTPGVSLRRTGGTVALPSTAPTFEMDGKAAALMPVLDRGEVGALGKPGTPPLPGAVADAFGQPGFFKPLAATPPADQPYAWAMVIDTSACIGCNACVVACQAENNGSVVGADEVMRGRDMHWLRIDTYDHGTIEEPRPGFQPVPCMHCETAPCEPVCPVAASVHDHEGLNVQVYNRCVGTRFCEANCPYKVRRFNFFGYAEGQVGDATLGHLDDPLVHAARNPDVSVRARGVMEKCTYCVQRISRARRTAEAESRTIQDGEVVTACQSACPTNAIRFGNKADGRSEVARLREDPRHYALLGNLNTRPRTTHLAKLRNPNPTLKGNLA